VHIDLRHDGDEQLKGKEFLLCEIRVDERPTTTQHKTCQCFSTGRRACKCVLLCSGLPECCWLNNAGNDQSGDDTIVPVMKGDLGSACYSVTCLLRSC
jgi:hypothetical protein